MPRAHVIRQQAEHFVSENAELAEAIAEVLQEKRVVNDGELVAGLTPSLRRLLDFLLAFQEQNGFAPSYAEMCDQLALGRSNIANMLTRLKERGYISSIRSRARAITILPAARRIPKQSIALAPKRLAA